MPRLFGFDSTPLAGRRALPLVGKPWRLFRFLDDPVVALLAMREHGDVVGLVRGDPALVAVFGPARVREVLSEPARFRHDETVFGGPPGSHLATLRHAIIAVNGDVHGRHRRLMAPAFGRAALQGYAEDITEVTDALLRRWPLGPAVRVDALTRELALCVAVRCFYGMDVLQGAHHNPAIYPEPKRFLPDRWQGFTPPAFSYLPFGAGPRTCLGAAFAQQALRIMLPMILRRFRFRLPDGAEVSRLTRANILLCKRGLRMDVEPHDRTRRPPGRVTGDIHDLVDLGEPPPRLSGPSGGV